jgi:uncharacterized protein YndB with AHSA1/START domain
MKNAITIHADVNAPVETAWECYTDPEHVVKWNNASPDWHTPDARNDLRTGGEFVYRMESKDGSEGFDFGGKYDDVKENELIAYTMGDGRRVKVTFKPSNTGTIVTVTFEPEQENSHDFQKAGWQGILNNFKEHAEECAE